MFEVRACGKTNCPPSSEYNLSTSGILQTYSCERSGPNGICVVLRVAVEHRRVHSSTDEGRWKRLQR